MKAAGRPLVQQAGGSKAFKVSAARNDVVPNRGVLWLGSETGLRVLAAEGSLLRAAEAAEGRGRRNSGGRRIINGHSHVRRRRAIDGQ